MGFSFSKKKKNIPHFFCETCGAEVDRNAKNCPGCGSTFSSVRCPGCGFVGEEARFKNGCPQCGYSAGTGEKKSKNAISDFPGESRKPAGSLPLWIYVLTAAAFTAIMVALFFTVFR